MSSPASVQGTNDSSVLSKCSMVKMGYYNDPFIRCFVSKDVRRAPLINRGYYVRCKAIEMILTQFIETSLKSNDSIQIISLGSGFDSLYFRIASNENHSTKITVFEVDYPEVMSRKLSIINSKETLRSLIKNKLKKTQTFENEIVSEGIVLDTPRYKLLGVDLCQISKLETILTKSGIIFQDVPTLLLSECAITYMDVHSSGNLIRWASTTFSNAVFACYEQILPMDGFGQVMCNHFKTLNSSLHSIDSFPNMNSQLMRYATLGWSTCDVMNMNTFYEECIELEERQRIDKLELFDEFEEFHLKCGHYILICATTGKIKMKPFPNNHLTNIKPQSRKLIMRQLKDCGKLNRFGHRSAFVDDLIVTVGGFGVSTGERHQRLNDVFVSDLNNQRDYTLLQDAENYLKEGRLFSSLTPLSNGQLVLIGGRTSPLESCSGIVLIDLKFVIPAESTKVLMTAIVTEGQERRWKHTATTIVIKGHEYIFVFGGRNEKEAVLGDCQLLSTDTWKWNKIINSSDTMMPSARHSHSACSWTNNKIIISGGLDENLRPLKGIYVFNGEQINWTSLETPALLPRYSHTSHVYKDKLILLGGVNCTSCPSAGLAVIDLNTGFSSEITLDVTIEPLLLIKHSSVMNESKEEITILGGGGTCFSFGTYFNRSAFVIKLNEIDKFD